MSIIRFNALQEALQRKPVVVNQTEKRSTLFGQNVL